MGYVPKIDQISLMKNALAVVQPTLFEGGPGGGASYDAISLGVPVIASDIPVNKEMNHGDVTYFSVGNLDELENILLERGIAPYKRKSNEILIADGLKRKKIAGDALKKYLLKY